MEILTNSRLQSGEEEENAQRAERANIEKAKENDKDKTTEVEANKNNSRNNDVEMDDAEKNNTKQREADTNTNDEIQAVEEAISNQNNTVDIDTSIRMSKGGEGLKRLPIVNINSTPDRLTGIETMTSNNNTSKRRDVMDVDVIAPPID